MIIFIKIRVLNFVKLHCVLTKLFVKEKCFFLPHGVDTSPTTASVPWWCRLYTQDSTTATLSWSGFQHTYSGASSCSHLNAAARLVFRQSRYDHVSDALATLHWLRLPQRVDFKVAVMVFRVLHGLVPPHLNDVVRVADLPGRRRLRSSSSHQLLVPPFWLTNVG